MACLTPIAVRNKKLGDGSTVAVPCSKCPECRMRRAKHWIFRLEQEEKRHTKSLFITLTYESPPMSHNGFMTLSKLDFQHFMMRLRKQTGIKTIKYYAVGEYGSKTYRPHYHAIIFDVKHEHIINAWSIDGKPIGNTHFGTVSGDSIAYTTKYMCKVGRIPLHEQDDRIPEFSLMSKRLGENFLSPAIRSHYESTQKSYLTLRGGYTLSLPRYYRNRLFTEAEREQQNMGNYEKTEKAYAKAVEEAGGKDAYYANRHYAIKQAFEDFKKRAKDRDAI